MTTTMFGIPNCNTIKKAKDWLAAHEVAFSFCNYKKEGIDEATLQLWCAQVDWSILLNKRGTTWRKLADDDKQELNQDKAIALMAANPSLIKRPVLVMSHEASVQIIVGFDIDAYQQYFVGRKPS